MRGGGPGDDWGHGQGKGGENSEGGQCGEGRTWAGLGREGQLWGPNKGKAGAREGAVRGEDGAEVRQGGNCGSRLVDRMRRV